MYCVFFIIFYFVGIVWFYYLSLILAVEAGTMLCEAIAVLVPDIRTAYQLIPGIVFFNFAFSGIFVKSPTLPNGAQWLPYVSLFKWTVEAQVINLFDDDSTQANLPALYFSAYKAFLNIFGWASDTKWGCFYVIVVNLAVYRGFLLVAGVLKTFAQKGRRQFRNVTPEDKLY